MKADAPRIATVNRNTFELHLNNLIIRGHFVPLLLVGHTYKLPLQLILKPERKLQES